MLAYEILRSESEDLRILISSDYVRFFTSTSLVPVHETNLSELNRSHPVTVEESHTAAYYIELTIRAEVASVFYKDQLTESVKRPRFRCDTRDIAISVSEQINYAKALYEERSKTLISTQELIDE